MRFLKAVEKAPTHKTLEVCSRKWERFDAELAAACFRGRRARDPLMLMLFALGITHPDPLGQDPGLEQRRAFPSGLRAAGPEIFFF